MENSGYVTAWDSWNQDGNGYGVFQKLILPSSTPSVSAAPVSLPSISPIVQSSTQAALPSQNLNSTMVNNGPSTNFFDTTNGVVTITASILGGIASILGSAYAIYVCYYRGRHGVTPAEHAAARIAVTTAVAVLSSRPVHAFDEEIDCCGEILQDQAE